MADLKNVNGEIAETVTSGFQKIEDGVVAGYKKIEAGAVGGFQKVEDWFVAKYLTHEGETVEEAKERLAAEQAAREESARAERSGPPLTKGDLFAAGLSGGAGSGEKRQALLKRLELPEHMSANALLAVLNGCYSRGEAEEILKNA